MWTDGSLILQDTYWLQTAAYAVVDDSGEVIHEGRVNHFSLSSFTAELFAGVTAFVTAATPVVIHTDCKTLVNMFTELQQRRSVPLDWAHREWWDYMWKVFLDRSVSAVQPCAFEWMPAHLCDHIALDEITDEFAQGLEWPKVALRCNRIAGNAAKRLAHSLALICIHNCNMNVLLGRHVLRISLKLWATIVLSRMFILPKKKPIRTIRKMCCNRAFRIGTGIHRSTLLIGSQ